MSQPTHNLGIEQEGTAPKGEIEHESMQTYKHPSSQIFHEQEDVRVPTQIVGVAQHMRKCMTDRKSFDDDVLNECKKKMGSKTGLEMYCIEGYSSRKLMTSIYRFSQTQDGSTNNLLQY
jgi:hypothetical protein